ncbi:VgrG-related protein [Anabaena sp. FACHB-1237]|uniref:VgrG-related protein n=1 Tax=Anabaena sp. FACHB-1237 TaxID=2692769 RepID=UPI00168032E0|nr:VgrG-related protein [Anabaena sp. FACHB-1237]MBD2137774.1 VgrG-related protein [Anabaena sp. FACHB-1237]
MTNATYAAKPILEIDGKSAPDKLMEDILQISVEESLHLPGMFTLIINNPYLSGREDKEKVWKHQELFEMGKKVKIGFAPGSTEEFKNDQQGYIIEGEITGIEAHFTSGSQAPIIIRGYDISHRLHRGKYNRSFQNMTDTDIVNKIIGEVGISVGKLDSTSIAHEYAFQENQTNMEFLRERAVRNGFELFVQDGKLNFRKPKVDDKLSLTWLTNLHSFRVRVTSSQQVSEVEVRGWDYSQKKSIVETAKSEKVLTTNQHGKGSEKSTVFKVKPKMIVVDQPIFNPGEAKNIAQALCDELGGEYIHADARAEGNPQIRPGKVIKLEGMGKYNGEYYVTETRHLYHERLYTTEFSVRGLRGGDMLSILSPKTQLQPAQTLLVGIVTNNKDPKNWGRVKVKLPTLTEEHESNWARVVSHGIGNNRGNDCLPEIGDEVLVGFEHGDIHRPYILGGVWNGKDKPPEDVKDSVDGGEVRLRTFKTRLGHVLQFVEKVKGAVKQGIQLKTILGHILHLNDTDKCVLIKTNGGHQVLLDDQNKKVEIKTSGGHTVILDDVSQSVSIKSNGSIKLDAKTTIDINASGPISIKGAIIKLN